MPKRKSKAIPKPRITDELLSKILGICDVANAGLDKRYVVLDDITADLIEARAEIGAMKPALEAAMKLIRIMPRPQMGQPGYVEWKVIDTYERREA
jgi:hypothetical protein